MLKRYALLCLILALAAALVVACGRRRDNRNRGEDKAEGPAKTAYVSKGDEGTISGKAMFDGQPPAMEPIDMSGDATCAAAGGSKMPDTYAIKDGKIANVFVYLKGGPADSFKYAAPSEPVN